MLTPHSFSKGDGFGRVRHAGRQLLERGAKVDWIKGEFLQRLLRVEAFKLNDLPFELVDPAKAVVVFKIRCEQIKNDAAGHDHTCHILQRSALGFHNAQGFFERCVGKHNHDARRIAR